MRGSSKLRSAGRRRSTVAVVFAVVGSMAFAACANDAEDSADDGVFTILALVATSGLYAPQGGVTLAGAEAAVEAINEAGGINGDKVEMKVLDTKSDPTRAVSLFTEEVASERPDMLWAGSSSVEAVALLPAATREKVPFVTGTAAPEVGDGKAYPYTFSVIGTQSLQAVAIAERLKGEGFDKIGLLGQNNVLGNGVIDAYVDAFEELDISVSREKYEPEDLDMSAPLGRLKGDDVDAVVFTSIGPAGAYILKSRKKAGIDDIPFYGDAIVAAGNIFSLITPAQAEGVQLDTYAVNINTPEAEQTEGKKQLLAALKAKNVEFTTTFLAYAIGWDAIVLGVNGFIEVGETGDARAWADAMESDAEGKFPAAVSANVPGYTSDVHFRSDMGGYVLLPASTPIKDGLFQFAP